MPILDIIMDCLAVCEVVCIVSYYASVKNGAVSLYKSSSGVPVYTFGSGAGIVQSLVSGDTIFCETKDGNKLVYKISGNSVSLIRSYR